MLKIALLCNGYGRVNRGAEQFTYQFYKHLRNNFDIDIYGIGETDHSIRIPSKFRDEFRLPWNHGRAYLESYYFGRAWYKRLIKEKRPEYDLLFNNAGFGCSYWCHIYRKKTGTPFITRARGGGNKEEKINLLFKPNYMIFLTKDNEIQSKRFMPKTKTIVIPNAIDVEEYNKKQKTSFLTEGLEKPVYLGTSAFIKRKRNDLIIKAVSLLKVGSLLLVGDGPLKDKTVKLGKKLLGSRFRYGGVIPFSDRDEVITLYHSADVFVQAANKEAFGNVFLEALASNTPVVTQDDARRKEIISDAGLLVNCTNIKQFAIALEQAAIFDWEYKPLEQAQRYSWQKIKKQYVDLIGEMENEKYHRKYI